MTTEEKADVMEALELGLDALILERDTHIEKYGSSFRPYILDQMNIDIDRAKKAQELMWLA